MDDFHCSYLTGHSGISRMQSWLSSHFYFPNINTIIADYVATCDHYWQVKSSNYTWSHIAMDIVSGFTPVMVNGVSYDAVLVTIDLFSSHVHFTAINTRFSADNLAE